MAIGYLNERTQKLINMVQKRSSALNIKEIAAELSVSARTIYNELDKANSWLAMKNLPEIRIVRGMVQPFSAEERVLVESAMQEEQDAENYIFTPTERIRMIVCQMIVSREPIYVEDLMNVCMVSRNTIFTDLQAVISQLYSYQLELRYEKKRGYWIEGDPIRVRAIFFLYFNMLEPLLSGGKLNFLHMEELEVCLGRIEEVEQELKVSYVRNDMLALAAMMPVMAEGRDRIVFSDVSGVKVRESREYQVICEKFPEFSDAEKTYLTLHFLGERLAEYSGETPQTEENSFVLEIAKNLVAEFERRACVVFERKDELIRNLYQHISSSLYRYRFGIQIGNSMAEDIRREYPYIFDVMRQTVQYLEQQIGVQISDNEVAYLALHFGGHLEYAKREDKELRILVVCMNGVATGNMLIHELGRILPEARLVGVTTVARLKNPQNICDLIVTSVRLTAAVPVIVVNPILNDFDRKNILNHPLVRSCFGFVDTEALYRTVKKFVPAERRSEFKKELERFFLHGREEGQMVLSPDVWRLTDFLTEDRVLFLDADGKRRNGGSRLENTSRMSVWEQAIYTTAIPLLVRSSMKVSYVENIIRRLHEAGPYMFVTKDLVLAHASPQNGVRHLDYSIGIAPEGIEFEGGKKARIIFCLVVEDQQKHMGILQDIRRSLAKAACVEELIAAGTPEKVCEILRNRLSDH